MLLGFAIGGDVSDKKRKTYIYESNGDCMGGEHRNKVNTCDTLRESGWKAQTAKPHNKNLQKGLL